MQTLTVYFNKEEVPYMKQAMEKLNGHLKDKAKTSIIKEETASNGLEKITFMLVDPSAIYTMGQLSGNQRAFESQKKIGSFLKSML